MPHSTVIGSLTFQQSIRHLSSSDNLVIRNWLSFRSCILIGTSIELIFASATRESEMVIGSLGFESDRTSGQPKFRSLSNQVSFGSG